MRPTLTTGSAAAKVSTTAICRKTRKKSRILSAECSAKLSAQSPPCSRKASPARPCPACVFSLRASPAKTSGGKPASCLSTSPSAAGVRIDGHLLDRLRPPARATSSRRSFFAPGGPAALIKRARNRKKAFFRRRPTRTAPLAGEKEARQENDKIALPRPRQNPGALAPGQLPMGPEADACARAPWRPLI